MTFRTITPIKTELIIKALLAFAVSACLLWNTNALAKMPKSIKYIEEIFFDDETSFVHYVVTCSNGDTVDISSWNNNKLWCVGKGKKESCNKKKIKTAKQVCK